MLHPYRLLRTSPFHHFRKGSQIGLTPTWEAVRSQAGSCSSRPITEAFTSRAHWVFSRERRNETCRSACHRSCPGAVHWRSGSRRWGDGRRQGKSEGKPICKFHSVVLVKRPSGPLR